MNFLKLSMAIFLGCVISSVAVAVNKKVIEGRTTSSLSVGIDLDNIDPSVRPQDDFYRYVNGQWLKKQKIPADRTNYGTFNQLADEAEINIKKIVEYAAKKPSDKKMQQVGDLYNSYMNEAVIEKLGLKPIAVDLEFIEQQKSKQDLSKLFSYLAKYSVTYPFGFGVREDAKDTENNIVYLGQSGLGLPDRDYYLKDDMRSVEVQQAYVAHIEKVLVIAKIKNAKQLARQIYELEKRIAKEHWTRVERRDANKRYNVYSQAGLQELVPNFDWSAFLKSAKIDQQDKYIVAMPSYFKALQAIIEQTPMVTWQAYSKWHLLDRFATALDSRIVQANFDFYRKKLSGAEEMRPRWKRGIAYVNALLGQLVGELYVKEHFKPEAKQQMEVLVANLKEAYQSSIEQLSWMSDETKEKALQKLSKFNTKIGYPDKWRDYSKLEIKADDLVGNIKRYAVFNYNERVSRLGKPVDKDEWFMNPQTVNAYYSPLKNEIVFPAAILQPPFFDLNADPAVNYGAIGAVIGHEIGHGFDDQGSKYDGDGNLKNWWTDGDRAEFNKRSKMLVEQYNQYTVLDGVPVNGKFTLGENIGDLGGLSIAYKAYQLSLNGKKSPVIANWTGEQRFFMGWAQIWRRKYRDEELRKRITTDSHSPSEYRVIGVLSNIPEFYSAFGIKEGDKMYRKPQLRVKIW